MFRYKYLANNLSLIYIYTVGISIRTNIFFSFIDSVLWLSWSITMSSLHTFLLLVFSIQILRAVTAERQYNSYADDEKSTYLSSVSNNRFNIFRYEDGRECTGILIILLWIKLTNYVRSPRYTSHNFIRLCKTSNIELYNQQYVCFFGIYVLYTFISRLYKKSEMVHKKLFANCFLLSTLLISLVFICSYYCTRDFCLSVIGL